MDLQPEGCQQRRVQPTGSWETSGSMLCAKGQEPSHLNVGAVHFSPGSRTAVCCFHEGGANPLRHRRKRTGAIPR